MDIASLPRSFLHLHNHLEKSLGIKKSRGFPRGRRKELLLSKKKKKNWRKIGEKSHSKPNSIRGKCWRILLGLENCGEEGWSIYRPVFQFAWRNSLCPELRFRLLSETWLGSIDRKVSASSTLFLPPVNTCGVYIHAYTRIHVLLYVLISQRSNRAGIRASTLFAWKLGLRFVSVGARRLQV